MCNVFSAAQDCTANCYVSFYDVVLDVTAGNPGPHEIFNFLCNGEGGFALWNSITNEWVQSATEYSMPRVMVDTTSFSNADFFYTASGLGLSTVCVTV